MSRPYPPSFLGRNCAQLTANNWQSVARNTLQRRAVDCSMHVAGCQQSALTSRHQSFQAQYCRKAPIPCRPQLRRFAVTAHRVDINVHGRTEVIEVEADQTILEVALEQGIELSHDCKMGVCMTCPAKLVRLVLMPHPVTLALVSIFDCCSRSQAELIRQLACWLKRFRIKAMLCYV